MADDFSTPCCSYDTSKPSNPPRSWVDRLLLALVGPLADDFPRARCVIMWNPYNKVVQCHNCGATFSMDKGNEDDE